MVTEVLYDMLDVQLIVLVTHMTYYGVDGAIKLSG